MAKTSASKTSLSVPRWKRRPDQCWPASRQRPLLLRCAPVSAILYTPVQYIDCCCWRIFLLV